MFLHSLMKSVSAKGLSARVSRIRRETAPARTASRLTLEELENRIAPATHYWVGGFGNNTWSTAKNWKDNNVPGPADTLIFDSQANTDSAMDAAFGNKIAVVKINPGFGKHSVSINAPLTVTSDLLLNDQNGTLVTNVTNGFVRNPQGIPTYVTFAINDWSFQAGKTDGKGVIEVTDRLIWTGGRGIVNSCGWRFSQAAFFLTPFS